MKPFRPGTPLVSVLLAVLLALAGPLGGPLGGTPAQATTVSATQLKARALYYQRVGDAANRQAGVDSIGALSPLQGRLWKDFLSRWDAYNTSLKINTAVPADLPTRGHAFVVLGSALTSTGTVSSKLVRRLNLARKALAAYPNSDVLVTGGAPRNGHTEAEVMRAWLLAAGIAESRILVEARAASTVGNATYSMALLKANPRYTSYTLISDASHIRRASVLFDAAAVVVQAKADAPWELAAVSHYAYPDKDISATASAATRSVITANTASVFGVLSAYNALLANPPKAAVLTSITVTPPARLAYAVGQGLDARGLVVTAAYNIAGLTRVVTPSARITGFSSKATGKRTVTVSYTENGVTRSASFTTTVARAASAVELSSSATKLKAKRTRAKVSVKVVPATAVTPSGTVKFFLDKVLLKTVKLPASGATVTLKYPRITRIGTHTITVTYGGDSRLEGSRASLKVKVKK